MGKRHHIAALIGLLTVFCAFESLNAEVMVCVDKNSMRLTVCDDAVSSDTIALFPISCGRGYGQKQKSGDMRTPEGEFHITEIIDASSWGHDFGDGKGYIRHAYGPWFFRLSAGRGIGIHGTHDPASMGYRASEGCIRLRNEDLLEFKKLVHVGTKVVITPDRTEAIEQPAVDMIDVKPYAVRTIEYITEQLKDKTIAL